MIIKKFQGKTEQDATDAAKAELGQNVVIMNVKTLKRKGFLGLFRAPKIEVTVGLEEERERPVMRTTPPISQQEQASAQKPFFKDIIPEPESSNALEEKLESIHSLIEQQLVKDNSTEADDKQEEIEEKPNEMVVFMKLIYNTLLDNEVNEKYANELMEEIEKSNKPGASIDYILSNIYQKMILKFGQSKSITPGEKGTKAVFFVGPTGVGKTTTIAKLASRFRVNDKKKVALLTTDTYRIAAAEQLRTYANILDVPFRVIYSVEEMEAARNDFKNYDYILVDTAGHSHHNEAQKESMNQFVHSLDGKCETEVYLVVSATTKYRDLLSIVDTYTEMTEFKLIFTKLDETTTLGNLLNLKLHTGAELSYVTCGQNVPDDIELFNPQATVKLLLGGK